AASGLAARIEHQKFKLNALLAAFFELFENARLRCDDVVGIGAARHAERAELAEFAFEPDPAAQHHFEQHLVAARVEDDVTETGGLRAVAVMMDRRPHAVDRDTHHDALIAEPHGIRRYRI